MLLKTNPLKIILFISVIFGFFPKYSDGGKLEIDFVKGRDSRQKQEPEQIEDTGSIADKNPSDREAKGTKN